MFNSPVIVIGPPRSGTTMTARVLQEWFGVLMDGAPMKPNKVINPYGWYEDSRVVQANSLLADGRIHIRAWTRRFKRYIRAMEKLDRPWGFKDPRIIPMFSYALSFFRSPTIIRCHRSQKLVVKSCVSKLGWGKSAAKEYYRAAEKSLDGQLENRVHYRLNIDGYASEESIIEFFESTEIVRHG